MGDFWIRGLAAAVLAAALLGLLSLFGVSLPKLLWAAFIAVMVIVAFPQLLLNGVGKLWDLLRELYWARHEGQYHEHRGLALRVHDDGVFVWIAGADLQTQLGSNDREDVLAARHAGHWQRDDKGRLMLRADAVVKHLASMPGRAEPRVVKLRRYIERDILYPAEQRRQRAAR